MPLFAFPGTRPLFLAITIAIAVWLICGNGENARDEPKEMANGRELNLRETVRTTSALHLKIQ